MTKRVVYDGAIYASQRECGISRYYTNLIEHLSLLNANWEYDIEVVESEGNIRLPQGSNVFIHKRRHFKSSLLAPLNYINFRYSVVKRKPCLVHLTLGRPYLWPPCHVVTTIHDLIVYKVPQYYGSRRFSKARLHWKRSAQQSSAIITVSQTSRKDIIDILDIDPTKVLVTYPGNAKAMRPSSLDKIEAFKREHSLTRPYVLYVGHRGEHKNFELLARAFAVSTELAQMDLVVVGGSDIVSESSILPESVRERLHHLKGVQDNKLRLLYSAASALVFPSLYEGFGFPLIEAMACGCPVVASDIPSTREVCGDACELFPQGDPEACASAILRICEPGLKNQLVEKGIDRAAQFTWDKCAQDTSRIYRSLL